MDGLLISKVEIKCRNEITLQQLKYYKLGMVIIELESLVTTLGQIPFSKTVISNFRKFGFILKFFLQYINYTYNVYLQLKL